MDRWICDSRLEKLRIGWTVAVAGRNCVLVGLLLTATAGCRTAASLGVPLASGGSGLLANALRLRNHPGTVSLPTELNKAALEPHRVEAGDVLVVEPTDFNGPIRIQSDQTVQQDGTIDLGGYGRIYVAGSSTAEIQAKVEAVIRPIELAKQRRRVELASFDGSVAGAEKEIDLGVTVRLVSQESSNIYVMGEVNAPGSYPINGNETVLDALISAGGLTHGANDQRIILARPQLPGQPRLILPVCYQQVVQLGDVATNYQLRPGDRIYVPSMTLMEDIRQSFQPSHEKHCPICQQNAD